MPAEEHGPPARAVAVAIPAVLCLLLVAQASYFHARKSITYDETFYLGAALQSVHDGELDPRLATWGVAPLPVLLDYGAPALAVGGESRRDLWKGELADPASVATARRIHLGFAGCGLIVCVYVWLLARRGWKAAAFGASLLALSPTVVAHASLATTDAVVALLVLLALAALDADRRRGSALRLFAAALAIAAAISAKYSALFLLGVAGVWMLWPGRAVPGGIVRGAARFGLLLAAVVPLVWALHGFASSEPLTPRTPRAQRDMEARWPTPLVGIRSQLEHQSKGHPGFLAGERSNRGWLAYYPVAFAAKSTPAELLLLAGALAIAVLGARSGRDPTAIDARATPWLWALAMAVYAVLALASSVSIGHRHLLVLYPLLVLWSVDLACEHAGRWPRALPWAAAVLVALQLGSAARIAPNYLAYFNFASGGPGRGYELLVDSNLDWGQDLIALRERLEALGSRCALLDYFGTADPEAYDVPAFKLGWSTAAELERCDHLAVSVTKLQEVYRPHPVYARLRERAPEARAGFSIFLYALADLPDEWKAELVEGR